MAANLEFFLISPDFPINFRKSHQISKKYFKSSQKPLGVPKDPLAWIGLRVYNAYFESLLNKFED